MSSKTEAVSLNLEEDDFEEFEDRNKVFQKKEEDVKEAPQLGIKIIEEEKKWDDDDIDELFPALLKQEISFQGASYVQPVGYTANLPIKKSRARQEAELLEREKKVSQQEFVVAQRKKALEGLTHALRDPSAKAVKSFEKKLEDSQKAVDLLFKEIHEHEDMHQGEEEHYQSAAAAEYAAWMTEHKATASAAAYNLREREILLAERERALKVQESLLTETRSKMKRSRRSSVTKMMAANTTLEDVMKKEEEESKKVLRVRQKARRRASIQATYDKVKGEGASVEQAQKLLVQAALSVARAEETEEHELLGDDEKHEDEAAPSSAKSKNLPYLAHKGDKIDAAVADELNKNQFDVSLKLIPHHKGKKGRNRNIYQLGNGTKIFVRVVHKVVVATRKHGQTHWAPLLTLLKELA